MSKGVELTWAMPLVAKSTRRGFISVDGRSLSFSQAMRAQIDIEQMLGKGNIDPIGRDDRSFTMEVCERDSRGLVNDMHDHGEGFLSHGKAVQLLDDIHHGPPDLFNDLIPLRYGADLITH